MKLDELTKSICGSDDSALQKAGDKYVQIILRAALNEIREKLEETKEGKFVVPVLGTFVVKNVTRKKGEEEIQVRKVVYHAPKVKADKSK